MKGHRVAPETALRLQIDRILSDDFITISSHSPGVFEIRMLVSEDFLRNDGPNRSYLLSRLRDLILEREASLGFEDETV